MNDKEDHIAAHRLACRQLKSMGKEGVYYVVRFPSRWRLYSFPWETFGDLWHGDAWRRFMVNEQAEAWTESLDLPIEILKKQLEPLWKGFPRGRVERLDTRDYTVFHGDDLAGTGITPERIQNAFELTNCRVKWSLDPHERQNPEHQVAITQLPQ